MALQNRTGPTTLDNLRHIIGSKFRLQLTINIGASGRKIKRCELTKNTKKALTKFGYI